MVRASLVHCTCVAHRCRDNPLGYTVVPKSTRQSHREDDIEQSLRQLTISNAVSSKVSEPGTTSSIVLTSADNDVQPLTQTASDTSGNKTSELATQLASLLREYQMRLNSFNKLKESLENLSINSPIRRSKELLMQEHISWMTATMCNAKLMSMGKSGLDQQRNMLVRMLEDKINDIQHWERFRYDERQKEKAVDVSDAATLYETGHFFNHSLATSHPLILLSMFITVVLNVIHGLPERSSNFLLQMHRDLLKLALSTWNTDGELVLERTALIMRLPKSIRTVRSRFGLDPQIQVFAACPKCSALFKPTYDELQDINVYSMTHCDQKELNGVTCGTALLKWRVSGKQTVRVPCRPYGYYRLHDFVGEMLCRPGLEELLERRSSAVTPDILSDVFDGEVIREFVGPEGDKCFQKNGDGSTLYLAWAMCVDWYNPYHNKIAGKSVSTGVISMLCLNLPPEIRNEASNIYLVGIIPGPREPSLHRVNNFLSPVIKDFQESWGSKGIRYKQTYKYDDGRTVVSILIPLVADLPASRKVSGTVGHGAICFCPLCLRKKGEINDVSVSFTQRDREQHLRLANMWKDAKTQYERKKLARKNGVRQSILFDLPYWEPRFIVVDAMHNLFLGVIKYHFQDVLGIKYEKRTDGGGSNVRRDKKGGGPMSAKKIDNILKLLKNPQELTSSRLKRYSIDDLIGFLACQNIPLSMDTTGGLKKDKLVEFLLNCELVNKDHAGKSQEMQMESMEIMNLIDDDALPFSSLEEGSFFEKADKSQPNAPKAKSKATSVAKTMSPENIEAIQAAIRKTCRPSWQQGPSKAFGTSQQGKIKADQWRTLLEFDIPVTLVELWIDRNDAHINKNAMDRNLILLDLTMELAIGVFWGTSRRTSSLHAGTYILHLQRYLQGLQTLSPKPKLVPNHHFALHIAEQLLLYGPVSGWWTFPYERLIGSLQQMNTSYRIGEVELTVLKTFYASAHLQRLFRSDECPKALSDHVSSLEQFLPFHANGSYGSNILLSPAEDKKGTALELKHVEQLDEDIYNALCSLTPAPQHWPNRQLLVHKFYILDGIRYTSRESERDNIIFYGNGTTRSPGIIRKIFSAMNGTILFAVHPYLKADCSDPFTRWPDFRAGLWSQKLDEKVQIIDPNNAHICHAACRAWKNLDIFVLRPIDRNY